MQKSELDKLVRQYIEEKKVRPSRINRPLTYTLYNNMLTPRMKRSEKDCTCLDRSTDLQVSKYIEDKYKLDPLPIQSTTKIDISEMGKPEPTIEEMLGLEEEKPKTTKKTPKKKTTRKRTTTKKNEGTKPNTSATDS